MQARPSREPTVAIVFGNSPARLRDAAAQLQMPSPRDNIQTLETAYTVARATIQALCKALLSTNPLLHNNTTSRSPTSLVSINWSDNPRSTGVKLLELPTTFSTFLDPAKERTWKGIFEGRLFKGFREFCIPAADLVYLLQCFMPGMISLVYMVPSQKRDRFDRVTDILPPLEWLQKNKGMLRPIFGEDRVMRLIGSQHSSHSLAHPLGQQVNRNVVVERD